MILLFLTGILSHLNSLNLHLHEAGKFVSSLNDHVKAKKISKKTGLAAKTTKKRRSVSYMACKKLIEED